MNVYIVEVAKRLAERGVEVDVFTRATSRALPPDVEVSPGVRVRHVAAGPYEELSKTDLLARLPEFTTGMMRAVSGVQASAYDVLHTHYWLSGQAGAALRRRLRVPLVHSMHTLAKVKNAALAVGDEAEPAARILGEEQVVASADRLVANTEGEAGQLVELYGAEPERVGVVAPGVDLSLFRPGSSSRARRRLGLAEDAVVLLFVGRLQPLKAPDVLLHAAAMMVADDPDLRSRLVVAVVGGPSGAACSRPDELPELAKVLGIADVVRFEAPCPQHELANWYRAADLTVVPSYNESFGLVAVESQACGTPVVAAAVGGLRTAVRDGETGVLVDGHDPRDYATVLRGLTGGPPYPRLARLAGRTVEHARAFGWSATVERLLEVYTGAVTEPTTVIA